MQFWDKIISQPLQPHTPASHAESERLILIERGIFEACDNGDLEALDYAIDHALFFSKYHVVSHILSYCDCDMGWGKHTPVTKAVYKHYITRVLQDALNGILLDYGAAYAGAYYASTKQEFVSYLVPHYIANGFDDIPRETLAAMFHGTFHDLALAVGKTRPV